MGDYEHWNTDSDAHTAMLVQHLVHKFGGEPPKEGVVHDIHRIAHELTGSLGDIAPIQPGKDPEVIRFRRACMEPDAFYLPPEWKIEDSLKLATTGYLV